jgi:hypothetical protein
MPERQRPDRKCEDHLVQSELDRQWDALSQGQRDYLISTLTHDLLEKLEEFLALDHRIGEREKYQLGKFVAWLLEIDRLPKTNVSRSDKMTLERAIELVVARAVFDPSMEHNEVFKSTHALAMECDPAVRGAHVAANNRAAVKHYVTTGEWKTCPEDVNAELTLLANAEVALRQTLAKG